MAIYFRIPSGWETDYTVNEVESQLFGNLTTEPTNGEGKYMHGKLIIWKVH